MSGTNGRNGSGSSAAFRIADALEGQSTPCFQVGCDDRIFVKKNSHIKPDDIKCAKGHTMLVWYSHETKTHIVTVE